MKTQQELKELAQKRNNIIYDDCFVDASKCEVCGCPDVVFIERPNGVVTECPDCEAYIRSRK